MVKIAETEQKQQVNGILKFDTKFKMTYFERKAQKICLQFDEVGDSKCLLGKCEVSLRSLANAQNYRFEAELKNDAQNYRFEAEFEKDELKKPGKLVVNTIVINAEKIYDLAF